FRDPVLSELDCRTERGRRAAKNEAGRGPGAWAHLGLGGLHRDRRRVHAPAAETAPVIATRLAARPGPTNARHEQRSLASRGRGHRHGLRVDGRAPGRRGHHGLTVMVAVLVDVLAVVLVACEKVAVIVTAVVCATGACVGSVTS